MHSVQFNNEVDWLSWRSKGIGASSAATLFDSNPFESRLDLWKKLRGSTHKKFETHRMAKGKDLEALLFPELRRVYKIDIEEQMCLEHPQMPYIRATLDGINTAHACLWEMKFIGDYEKYMDMRYIPRAHQLQIQQQLLLAEACFPTNGTGRTWKAFYIYSNGIGPKGIDWKVIEESPDQQLQQKIIEKINSFWQTHVIGGIPPEASPVDAIERNDKECAERCKRLRYLMPLVEEAEQIKNELKELGADTPFRCSGVNYSFNTKLSTARYKTICEHPVVLKALEDNGMSIDDFRDAPIVQKRIWIDK